MPRSVTVSLGTVGAPQAPSAGIYPGTAIYPALNLYPSSGGAVVEPPITPPIEPPVVPPDPPVGPPAGYTTISPNAATFDAGCDANTKTYLPGGIYTFSDFLYPTNPTMGAYLSNCVGLVGAGIDKTFIRMNADTSTKASAFATIPQGQANPYNLVYMGSKSGRGGGPQLTISNFTVVGTSQPHVYNGFMLAYSNAPIISNIKIHGIPGTTSAPPTETFSLSLYDCLNATVSNCILDGRRNETGSSQAASLLGLNNSDHASVSDTTIRYTSVAFAIAAWQSTDGNFTRCTFDHSGRVPIHIENCDGVWNFTNCTWTNTGYLGGNEYHAVIAHADGNYTPNKFYGTGKAVLNVYDPTYDDFRRDGKFHVRIVLHPNQPQPRTVGSGTTPGAVNLYIKGVLRPDLVVLHGNTAD